MPAVSQPAHALDGIREHLDRARRRLVLARWLGVVAYGVAGLLAVWCVSSLLVWVGGDAISVRYWLRIGAAMAVVLACSLLWIAWTGPARLAFARRADGVLGTQERFSTALEVSLHPDRWNPVSRALVDDAVARADAVRSRALIPLRLARPLGSVALFALAAVLLASRQPAGEPEAPLVAQSVEASPDTPADALPDVFEEESDPQLLADPLEAPAEEPQGLQQHAADGYRQIELTAVPERNPVEAPAGMLPGLFPQAGRNPGDIAGVSVQQGAEASAPPRPQSASFQDLLFPDRLPGEGQRIRIEAAPRPVAVDAMGDTPPETQSAPDNPEHAFARRLLTPEAQGVLTRYYPLEPQP